MKFIIYGLIVLSGVNLIESVPLYDNEVPSEHMDIHFRTYSHPKPEDIEFNLYTRLNPDTAHRLVAGNQSTLYSSNFDPEKELKIIIHGFHEAGSTPWLHDIKNQYLIMNDWNVMIIDWGKLSGGIRYDKARDHVFFTGEQLAILLYSIQEVYPEFSGNQIHIAGFSLGAHVAGTAGRDFPGIARITGLDAAGPLFEDYEVDKRLDDTDADFVDVIHTNAGLMISGHFGYNKPLGHVDFYVNGGSTQYGCPPFFADAIIDIIELHPNDIDPCSHGRAHDYYLESLKSNVLPIAYKTHDYEHFQNGNWSVSEFNILGYHSLRSNTGVYHLFTRGEIPFFGHHAKISLVAGEQENYVGSMLASIQNIQNNREYDITRADSEIKKGSTHTVTMLVPQGVDIQTMEILLKYHRSHISVFHPYYIDIQKVELYTDQNTRRCLVQDIRMEPGETIITKLQEDSCTDTK